MTEQGPEDFPVDLVVAWVQMDQAHIKLKCERENLVSKDKSLKLVDAHVTRFRDNSEIMFCLRSVYQNMSWVRNIFLVVADHQYPSKYIKSLHCDNDGPKLYVIKHSQFFRNAEECLPTFNSQAIECNIWNIPNLSEHFLYSND